MYYIYQNDFIVNKYVFINLIGFFFFFQVWDKALAKVAKSWSKKCKFSHNPCIGKRYACTKRYDFLGENMYVGDRKSTPNQIISRWYNEREHYNFENMTCSKTCGHYTQVGT